jgi:crotonobetainyl-CoA:carnitine CoA-transferase CaiB-like acyl-CoA transferase
VGTCIEVTMVEGALNAAAEAIVEFSARGNLLGRTGNRAPCIAPQGLYRCAGKDEWLAVTVETDEQWLALVDALDSPSLKDRVELMGVEGREARHDEIDAVIGEWACSRDAFTAADGLTRVGVPAAPARDPRLMLEHPQLQARGFHEMTTHPILGTHLTPSMPFRSRKVAQWLHRPGPTLGQHNFEVFVEEMGMSLDRYAELLASGVIGDSPP